MIDFPASPTTGQTFTAAGVTWTWDGAKWTANGLNVPYLPLSGGTLSGPLTLVGDPAAALQPATKQYVDAGNVYPRDNRIINGDMRIDQRNNGASGTATGTYTVDRWFFTASQTGKGTWQRITSGAAGLTNGLAYNLQFVSSSAYASVATDSFNFNQRIEADMLGDLAWGTASAQPITLSFWFSSSVAGTYSGAIRNDTSTRSYPFSFQIPQANTWTKIAVTIPGDTVGPWVLQGNAVGMYVHFDLGAGANLRGPANAWASANYFGATGAVSVVGTNGATFNLTGVKLEIGSVATPFNRQSLAKSLVDCQRYCQRITTNGTNNQAFGAGFCASASLAGIVLPYKVSMRATPTLSVSAAAGFVVNGLATNGVNPVGFGPDGMQVNLNTAASLVANSGATASVAVGNWLGLDAEL